MYITRIGVGTGLEKLESAGLITNNFANVNLLACRKSVSANLDSAKYDSCMGVVTMVQE